MAALAKILAVCGATAAGGAACVATGVVEPATGVGSGSSHQEPALERPADAAASVVAEESTPAVEAQTEASVERQEQITVEPPVKQKDRQFSFEAAASSSETPSGGGGGEFGGPSSGGGGSGGGGSPGAGGFGIE